MSKIWTAFVISFLSVLSALADTAGIDVVGVDAETKLFDAIASFRGGNLDDAIITVESLIDQVPNYRLAHLIHGDLMAASAGRPVSLAAESYLPRDAINPLLQEARQRYLGQGFDPDNNIPAALVQLSTKQDHAVVVDLSRSRLYLFRNTDDDLELIKDYYVSIGKNGARKETEGDRKTPLGVYKITQRLPGSRLPDKYGPVAFPVNYPNAWDRLHSKTGSGIWLHGMPSKNFSRPPLDSDGCVALTNVALLELQAVLRPGVTPVLIGENLEWASRQKVRRTRSEITGELEKWRVSWDQERTEDFLSYYDDSFSGRGMDLEAWKSNKRRVIPNSGDISIELSNVSVLAHPEEKDLMLVTFDQDYKSAKFSSGIHKRQYWRKNTNGSWRIVFEGA